MDWTLDHTDHPHSEEDGGDKEPKILKITVKTNLETLNKKQTDSVTF